MNETTLSWARKVVVYKTSGVALVPESTISVWEVWGAGWTQFILNRMDQTNVLTVAWFQADWINAENTSLEISGVVGRTGSWE